MLHFDRTARPYLAVLLVVVLHRAAPGDTILVYWGGYEYRYQGNRRVVVTAVP